MAHFALGALAELSHRKPIRRLGPYVVQRLMRRKVECGLLDELQGATSLVWTHEIAACGGGVSWGRVDFIGRL